MDTETSAAVKIKEAHKARLEFLAKIDETIAAASDHRHHDAVVQLMLLKGRILGLLS